MNDTTTGFPAMSLTALQTLRASVRGTIITPHDSGYDKARSIWNGTIDRRPAIIARCVDDDDVIACVRFAREAQLPLTVRGGGHNVAGSAMVDDGLVIDLSSMRRVELDAQRRRAVVEGGATIGDLDFATQPHGLAAPMGVVSATGVAGLTLGGGIGWMRRKHGLSSDALRSVDLVTADGRLLHASSEENSDLFWGLRGGGSGLGVVVRFEFELYPVGPDTFHLAVFYPRSIASDVIVAMSAWMEHAPEEFSGIAVLGHVPAGDPFPPQHHGEPMVALVGPWIGDPEEGERALAHLRHLGEPIADLSGRMSYCNVQQFFDADYPDGGRYYWKSTTLERLDGDAIERLIELNDDAPALHSTIDIWFHGGAMRRVESGATAYADRTSPILIGIEANWHDPDEDQINIAWGRRLFEEMRPWSNGGSYVNFPGTESELAALAAATYGENYTRLLDLRCTWDPEGLFAGATSARHSATTMAEGGR